MTTPLTRSLWTDTDTLKLVRPDANLKLLAIALMLLSFSTTGQSRPATEKDMR